VKSLAACGTGFDAPGTAKKYLRRRPRTERLHWAGFQRFQSESAKSQESDLSVDLAAGDLKGKAISSFADRMRPDMGGIVIR